MIHLLVRDTVGARGVAGRFGGDEFVALLPDLTQAEALRCAEALRQRVATVAVPTGAGQRVARTTVSVGLTVSGPDDDLADMLWRADSALYAAKAAGRSAVRVA